MGTPPSRVGPGDELRFDVVVIGAGVAGLVAALDLLDLDPDLAIAVIDKGAIGASGSTPLAQGGMAAAVGPGDSPDLHARDTLRAGDGLCDPRAVWTMAAEGPVRVADLVARGAVFDRHASGALDLAREGGQSVDRSVRAADATGAEIFRALRTAATGRVTRLQGIACTLTARQTGAVDGAWILLDALDSSPSGPVQEPGLALVRGRATLLATGGCGGLYAATTNRDRATADGIALAYGVGAALVDMEFVQFHPTGLKVEPQDGYWRLLLTEALRGAGARLIDARGTRFMQGRHPDLELAPRHIVTKAILDQPDGAWLDATAIPARTLEEEFPTVAAGVRRHGFDLAREPVPVEPAEHYMIGGVATDLFGRSTVEGLYAAGEVACTGVHGANRMAGNSLLQSCVFAHRAAGAIAAELRSRSDHAGEVEPPALTGPMLDTGQRSAIRDGVRRAMSAGVGAIRSAASLETAEKALRAAAQAAGSAPAAAPGDVELHHLLHAARLIVRSAALREESRGAHWREDFPESRAQWAGVRLRVSRPSDLDG
ncbi:MAG TPA: FAD-binding protein [Egibacteraceae bacterium]|nr:FAD-binding protein [Egibacteraceae bacterium]